MTLLLDTNVLSKTKLHFKLCFNFLCACINDKSPLTLNILLLLTMVSITFAAAALVKEMKKDL